MDEIGILVDDLDLSGFPGIEGDSHIADLRDAVGGVVRHLAGSIRLNAIDKDPCAVVDGVAADGKVLPGWGFYDQTVCTVTYRPRSRIFFLLGGGNPVGKILGGLKLVGIAIPAVDNINNFIGQILSCDIQYPVYRRKFSQVILPPAIEKLYGQYD